MLEDERGDLLEDARRLRSLIGPKCGSEPIEFVEERADRALHESPALRGGLEQQHPTVAGMGVPAQELVLFEAVGDAGHRAGVQAERASGIAGADTIGFSGADQDQEFDQPEARRACLGDEIALQSTACLAQRVDEWGSLGVRRAGDLNFAVHNLNDTSRR